MGRFGGLNGIGGENLLGSVYRALREKVNKKYNETTSPRLKKFCAGMIKDLDERIIQVDKDHEEEKRERKEKFSDEVE